jgi:ectoine hydroxylase-related dioxygenase (phytanoyl-CoA dioxygenase family)
MKASLSAEQIAAYRRNGFLVVEGFLDAGELEDWRVQVGEAVQERKDAATKGPGNLEMDPDDYYAKVFLQAIKLADTHAGVHRLMHQPDLGRMVAELAGVEGMRIWHDQALIKPPYGNPTGWHLDNPYWSFTSPNAISLWVALDDATLSNGCLSYLPGTHLAERYDEAAIGANLGDLFRTNPDWMEIDPVACPCPAGSAVFHNGLTAHGAGANMTNRPRRAMTCAYMPDGSVFNGKQNVLPPEYFATLAVGDVLDDPVVNPLVWPR